ncbi:MAG TPA: hypothetical protein VJG67_00040 [Candidatus Paceibacterota bacterium]
MATLAVICYARKCNYEGPFTGSLAKCPGCGSEDDLFIYRYYLCRTCGEEGDQLKFFPDLDSGDDPAIKPSGDELLQGKLFDDMGLYGKPIAFCPMCENPTLEQIE